MKKISRMFLWLMLFNKRLLKKISFLIILCSIPLLVLGVNLMAKQESGILRVVLYQEDADELSEEIVSDILQMESALSFVEVESEEEAIKLVQSNQADAAWIFPEDFEGLMEDCFRQGIWDEPLIRIVEKEDNVMLHLSREVLFGRLYSSISYMVYDHFVRTEVLGGTEISEEELWESYQKTNMDENMFVFSYLDGETADMGTSYMLYPVRGLLALVIVLCGLALGLYFMQDEQNGIFIWMPLNRTVLGSWLYQMPGLVDVGLVVLLALLFSGVATGVLTEIGLMFVYLWMVAGFSDLVRRLCGKQVRLGAMIPLLMLVMLAVTPIFMGAPNMKWIQLLLPPYYYINALHSNGYRVGMLVYVVVIFVVDFLVLKLQARKRPGA